MVGPTDERPANLGDVAARGTAITLLVQVLRVVVQFGSVVVLARLLVPEDFGLVAMVTAVIGLADLVRDLGLSTAAMQSPTLSEGERDNLFWANLLIGLGCSLLVVAATPLIVLLYDEPRLTGIVLALAPVFALSGFTTQFRAGLARQMRFKALGFSELGGQAVAAAVAIALAVAGFGLWALVVQQVLTAAAVAVICVVLAGWWPGLPRRSVSIRRFLRFGVGVFGTESIGYLTKNVDNIAIGAVYGAAPLGLYSRAYQLMRMPLQQINAPLNNVVLPVLRHVQRDDREFLRYLGRAQLVLVYTTTVVFAVLGGLAEPVVLVLFGDVWVGVAPILAVLAVAGVFRAAAGIPWWAYLARGKSGALFRQRLVTGLLGVVAILAGVPWGAVGVATGVAVGAVLAWVIGLWHVGRVTGLNTRPLLAHALKVVVLVGVPTAAAAFVGTLVPWHPLLQIVVGSLLAAGALGLGALLLPGLRADVRVVATFGRRALRRSAKSA
jgi:PST family polysaccharide transporter